MDPTWLALISLAAAGAFAIGFGLLVAYWPAARDRPLPPAE